METTTKLTKRREIQTSRREVGGLLTVRVRNHQGHLQPSDQMQTKTWTKRNNNETVTTRKQWGGKSWLRSANILVAASVNILQYTHLLPELVARIAVVLSIRQYCPCFLCLRQVLITTPTPTVPSLCLGESGIWWSYPISALADMYRHQSIWLCAHKWLLLQNLVIFESNIAAQKEGSWLKRKKVDCAWTCCCSLRSRSSVCSSW